MLFALFLPVVVGAAGFGVETTYWYYKRLSLQAAADAAAYGAALERRQGGTNAEIQTVAEAIVQANGFNPAVTGVAVNQTTVSGGGTTNVVLTDKAERFFTALFISSDPLMHASATAAFGTSDTACILALSPTAGKAADFSGSSTLTLDGCSVMSNSNATNSINVQGAATLYTTCTMAVGGIAYTSGLHLTSCSSVMPNTPSAADPYASVPEPAIPSGGCKNKNANNQTIQPGYYCNGLDFKNNVTMAPGVYYIDTAQAFNLNNNAVVTGTGVTIYLKGSASLSINGGAKITVQAPTTGTYSGMLFMGDRTAGSGLIKFNGTADSLMTGAIYFPHQNVTYNGNFSGINGCTQVIGDTVTWNGNTTVGVDCSAYGMNTIPVGSIVRMSA